MLATHKLPRLTPQEYFEWEAKQYLRYEYFDGQVFAISVNLIYEEVLMLQPENSANAQPNDNDSE